MNIEMVGRKIPLSLIIFKGLGRRFSWDEFLAGNVEDDIVNVEICGVCYDG